MKKFIMKLKILVTNISRVIMSLLFVNIEISFMDNVFAVSPSSVSYEITCYDVAPPYEPKQELNNILIFLVPIVIIIGVVIFIVIKKNKKTKEEKKDDKKD